MKRLLNLGLSLLLLIGICDIQGVKALDEVDDSEIIRNDETGIPDRLLYRMLLEKCDSNDDQLLSVNELQEVTCLYSNDKGIANLKGIEHLVNLNYLELTNERITDTEPLKNLHDLKYLKIENSSVNDLSGLSNLTNLTELYLGKNNISDISALKDLTNLEILELQENNISDISFLSNMSLLSELKLNKNKITELSSISNMANLKSLEATSNNINDISGLRGAVNLNNLDLRNNNIKDIDSIKYLLKLERLYLQDNKIEKIDSLDGLIKLKDLDISRNNIADITAVKSLLYLDMLYATENKLERLPNLTLLINLEPWDGYWYSGTLLYGNKLTEQELKNKMPKQLAEDNSWINQNKYKIDDVTNVHITSIGSTSMKLEWDQCANAKYYKVYRSNNYYGEKKLLGTVDGKSRSFTDKNLNPNQRYYYYVIAFDEVNGEVISSEYYSEDAAGTTAPQPTVDVKAVSAGKNKVKVTWSESEGADGYIIYRKIGNGKFEYRYMVSGTSFTDTTASSSDYNFYRVYPYYESWEYDKRILADGGNYDYAKGILKATSDLKVVSAGKNKVNVKWNKVDGADGYIIYRRVGNGKFEYRYMVSSTSFTDATASGVDYNYYRIYPYHTENGKRVLGISDDYKYGKGTLRAVTNLKAATAGKNKVNVTWNKVENAEGYVVYRKVGNGKFEYRYMVKGTSFTDTTASNYEYNYYRIYPYHTENSKRVLGASDDYKYAKGSLR